MSWDYEETSVRCSKKAKHSFEVMPDLYKSQYQINKHGKHFTSEYGDQFIELVKKKAQEEAETENDIEEALEHSYDPQKYFKNEDNTQGKGDNVLRESIEQNGGRKTTHPRSISEFKSASRAPEYIDKFSLKDFTTKEELMDHLKKNQADLIQNEVTFGKRLGAGPSGENERNKKPKGARLSTPFAVDGEGSEESEVEGVSFRDENEEEERGQKEKKSNSHETLEESFVNEEAIQRPDYSKVQSRLFKVPKKAKKLDPKADREKLGRRIDRIKHMKETTRWMPNSSFQTYFGKPAFEVYGRVNTNPPSGGTIYGQYMFTHNVNPHRAPNNPKHAQVYKPAEVFASRMEEPTPEPPRKVVDDYRLSQNQVKVLMERSKLTAPRREINQGALSNFHHFSSIPLRLRDSFIIYQK